MRRANPYFIGTWNCTWSLGITLPGFTILMYQFGRKMDFANRLAAILQTRLQHRYADNPCAYRIKCRIVTAQDVFLQWDYSICDCLLACSCLCFPLCHYRCPVFAIAVEEEHFGSEREVREGVPGEWQNGNWPGARVGAVRVNVFLRIAVNWFQLGFLYDAWRFLLVSRIRWDGGGQ